MALRFRADVVRRSLFRRPEPDLTEHCCEQLQNAVDNDAIVNAPLLQMNGRILNEIDSDYAVRSPEERPSLFPINFCPFCGRAVSRTVWNAEKKK